MTIPYLGTTFMVAGVLCVLLSILIMTLLFYQEIGAFQRFVLTTTVKTTAIAGTALPPIALYIWTGDLRVFGFVFLIPAVITLGAIVLSIVDEYSDKYFDDADQA